MSKFSIPELQDLFLKNESTRGNITQTAKAYCSRHRIVYNDNIRRRVSSLLNQTKTNDSVYNVTKTNSKTPARILVYDIETSPYVSYHWDLWNQNINYDDVIQDWKILTFSAKWLFEDEIITDKLTPRELNNFDDKRITKNLWKLLDKASIVIAHNGKKFDNKRATAKFLEHGLVPPASYQTIDTVEHARKKFALPSNRLDAIAKKLKIGQKMETPKGMWREVMEGNYAMLETMADYCDHDVRILEDVYLNMRPYIQPHPNVGLYIGESVKACPSCGSDNLTKESKPYYTTTAQYDLVRCNCCGSLSRSRKKGTLSSVPM